MTVLSNWLLEYINRTIVYVAGSMAKSSKSEGAKTGYFFGGCMSRYLSTVMLFSKLRD